MSREVMLFALVIAISSGAVAAANAQARMNFLLEGKQWVVYAPPPEYPYEARAERLMGRALVLLKINAQTGRVSSVQLLQSTRYKILDDAALRSCINTSPFQIKACIINV
jgi:TonB family protein